MRLIPAALKAERPGTLTVTYGNERVTLDPLSPTFDADSARMQKLLEKMSADLGNSTSNSKCVR